MRPASAPAPFSIDDLVAGADQFVDARRDEPNAIFVNFDFLGYADPHRGLQPVQIWILRMIRLDCFRTIIGAGSK